jgi:hypothetical protein
MAASQHRKSITTELLTTADFWKRVSNIASAEVANIGVVSDIILILRQE